jgi:phage terminase large subunit-like protein
VVRPRRPRRPRPIETHSKKVAQFFSSLLKHVKGEWAGQPLELDPWQYRDIIKPLFGTRLPDGRRQYRTCYVELPRKNGKSTLAAGIALYLLFADQEPGSEVVSAAADREQASIVFEMARQMIEHSPTLAKRCKIYRRAIETRTGGVYRAISAEAYSKHGLNLHGIIFDEVHAQPNRELWDVLSTSTGARRQPLTFAITTAGHDRSSLCYELHSYAKGVRSGTIEDPSFLPIIYSIKEGQSWKTPEAWKAANPGYGISVREEYFIKAVREAIASPGSEQSFRRLHLCEWTDGVTRWIPLERWDQCEVEQWPDLTGQPAYAALDLSSTTDLTSLALAWPVDDLIYVKTWNWAPQGALHTRERLNRVRFDPWAARGKIEVTDGDVIDYDRVTATLFDLAKIYQIREVSIDRWNAAAIAQTIQTHGLPVIAFGQGYASMSPATKDLEALVLSGKLKHDGGPVLRWAMSNVCIETDPAGNVKPSKRKSSEKIDPAVAMIMAVARARLAEASGTSGGSVYEGRGLSSI